MRRKIATDVSSASYPVLTRYRGFLYCDLLLSQGKFQEVQIGPPGSSKLPPPSDWLHDVPFTTCFGSACCCSQARRCRRTSAQQGTCCNVLWMGCGRPDIKMNSLRGLLARAACTGSTANYQAHRDLTEARPSPYAARCGCTSLIAIWNPPG